MMVFVLIVYHFFIFWGNGVNKINCLLLSCWFLSCQVIRTVFVIWKMCGYCSIKINQPNKLMKLKSHNLFFQIFCIPLPVACFNFKWINLIIIFKFIASKVTSIQINVVETFCPRPTFRSRGPDSMGSMGSVEPIIFWENSIDSHWH